MRLFCLLPLVVIAACAGATSDDTDDVVVDDGPKVFEDFVNTDVVASGDLSCFTPGDAWILEQAAPGSIGTITATSAIEDFQSDAPVAEATLQVWFDDDPTGAPDSTDISDDDGNVSLQVQTCAPLVYKVTTDPDLEATVDTFEAHQVFGADSTEVEPFNSVSVTTYKLIPSILGLSVQPGNAVIAGTAYDCNRSPIEGAQVVVKDRSSGDIIQQQVVKYFVDDFPNREQPTTSADGLWNAIDVPDGSYTVEMWAFDGTTHVLLGATELDVVPDSINISNIHVGYGDGVKLPASCLAE